MVAENLLHDQLIDHLRTSYFASVRRAFCNRLSWQLICSDVHSKRKKGSPKHTIRARTRSPASHYSLPFWPQTLSQHTRCSVFTLPPALLRVYSTYIWAREINRGCTGEPLTNDISFQHRKQYCWKYRICLGHGVWRNKKEQTKVKSQPQKMYNHRERAERERAVKNTKQKHDSNGWLPCREFCCGLAVECFMPMLESWFFSRDCQLHFIAAAYKLRGYDERDTFSYKVF